VDVLEFDGSVERAIHYACGNALVCDTMDIAKHVVYDKGQEVKGKTFDLLLLYQMSDDDAVSCYSRRYHHPQEWSNHRWKEHSWIWEEVGGERSTRYFFPIVYVKGPSNYIGLTKQKDNLLAQLRELNQSKVRSSRDENLVAEITRLESALSLATDDLVGLFIVLPYDC
jgi:structural maintenance of chromosome 1